MKPGITGLVRIHGFRGETDTIDKMKKGIQYVLEYIQSWALLLAIPYAWADLRVKPHTGVAGIDLES